MHEGSGTLNSNTYITEWFLPFLSSEDLWPRLFESLCQDSAVDHSACEEAAQEVANPSSPVRHAGAYFMFNRIFTNPNSLERVLLMIFRNDFYFRISCSPTHRKCLRRDVDNLL